MQKEKRIYIEPNEIIESCSYVPMCDYQYNGQDDLPGGIVHCDICSIKEFFEKINENGKEYVVVSSSSDFGIYYQRQFPVWEDIGKAAQVLSRPEDGYKNFSMPARCNLDKCNKTDIYSIKCYCFTHSTFSYIPKNVIHWFTVNCGISDPQISAIPFGILSKKSFLDTINSIKKVDINSKLLYVNFQWYTKERYDFYCYFKSFNSSNITVEKEVDYVTYINRLYEHKYCVSPTGNGADGYRNLECLYTGCVPIMNYHPGLKVWLLSETPQRLIFTDSLYKINRQVLEQIYEQIPEIQENNKYNTLSYWKNRIQNAKNH